MSHDQDHHDKQKHDHHQLPSNVKRGQFPLDPTSYKILDEIGVGVSAVVYKALCLPMNSAVVAIKSIDLDQSRADFDNVRREAKIMSLLSHPNILNAHCSFTVDSRLWVVMPFMSAGSLQSIITSSFPDGFSEPCIAVVLREILSALSYLHDQGHLHRDIKAGNILVDSSGAVKLADFGVSASIHESNSARGWSSPSSSMLTDVAGTPYWMAPEVLHSHNGYGIKADIWSFGITALELAHGRPPLSHLPLSKSLVLKITKRFRFSDYEKSKNAKSYKKFSKSFKEMVGLCLDQDPSKRPPAEKLLKHTFFRNCNKGLDFLVKNVLHGLPSVEDRFRMMKRTLNVVPMVNKINVDEDDVEDDEEMELTGKKRRISGWNFNEDGFELDPVFPTESEDDSIVKQVRFGGETIILNRGGESTGESDPSSLSQTGELNESSSSSSSLGRVLGEGAHAEGVLEERGGESSKLLPGELGESNLSSLDQGRAREGVIDRDSVMQDLIFLRRNLENERQTLMQVFRLLGVEDAAEATREEYLERVVERLRTELESEKKKNSELELEVEFLKMQVQCDN